MINYCILFLFITTEKLREYPIWIFKNGLIDLVERYVEKKGDLYDRLLTCNILCIFIVRVYVYFNNSSMTLQL